MGKIIYGRYPQGDVPVRHNLPKPLDKVTIKCHLAYETSRYDGAKLRQLRAERGVGRPPKK